MYETILYEVKDQIAYITINRPKALNALNSTVLTELIDAAAKVEADPDVRVAIVTGEGRAFVAGADISQMRDMETMEAKDFMALGHKAFNAIDFNKKPFIAAVNGFALGGGCELSMACDFRIASEKAKFGQPEVNLGIIPGFGGTQRLPRLVGKGMAKYMIYTAEMIDAAEALRIGLVQKVVPAEELMAEAEKAAKLIISKAPIAILTAKAAINYGYDMDMHSASEWEALNSGAGFSTEDQKEGMTAFLEKRPAVWKNK
ncbi:MAG: enoyl-CoA hydratase/isomerase family protein [Eubacterium sp.]|nr:enoyl-CoA hydratase/isomerase family protein [Eubacterium sp.]